MKKYIINKFQLIGFLFVSFLFIYLTGCSPKDKEKQLSDIIIENSQMKLIISSDGTARSLIHKASRQECLKQNVKVPISTLTQYMPYQNEHKLAFLADEMTFSSNSVRREGNDLIVGFELIDYEATIGLEITEEYIGFTLKKLDYHRPDYGEMRVPEIDEFTMFQLPVKNRGHFGQWLNVTWDEDIAVNLLATNHFTRIDAKEEERIDYRIFRAGGMPEVKVEGVEAVLLTTDKSKLLDQIDQVERDYNLPLGVKSRRRKEYQYSYYENRKVTLKNIDEHIAYAKKGGFRIFTLYYRSFTPYVGSFEWGPDYPNGIADVKKVVCKIEEAGMIPGFHLHYNKAHINDAYVTPKPDPRLNMVQFFTLREDLSKEMTTITVHENPTGCNLHEKERLLKLRDEIIQYENYTTTLPYQFTGCERGYLNTTAGDMEAGEIIGLLDVDTWPYYIRFNQKTDIQDVAAQKLAALINAAGFQYLYYDGVEDAPYPYWFNISKAMMAVHNKLDAEPLFSEGACKSHFSWHVFTRGNAFDAFPPEFTKDAVRKHPLAEIEFIANDFTSVDFGWIKYEMPNEKTMGHQPDMLEFVISRAAGWNSGVCFNSYLDRLNEHPRTDDNLEVFRRWEDAKANNFFTAAQREELKSHQQEHILLIDEKGAFELQPYKQIEHVAGGSKEVRAFIFERNHKTWVVYWHISGEGKLKLPVSADHLLLYKELGQEIPVVSDNQNHTVLPAGERRYIEFNLSKEEVIRLFANARYN